MASVNEARGATLCVDDRIGQDTNPYRVARAPMPTDGY